MAKFVLLGLEGETGLYLVDIEGGTVSSVDVPPDSEVATAGEAGSAIRGVTLAVVTESRESAVSGKYD